MHSVITKSTTIDPWFCFKSCGYPAKIVQKVWIMSIFVKYFSPILAGKILAGKLEVEVCTAISKGKQSTNIAIVLLQNP